MLPFWEMIRWNVHLGQMAMTTKPKMLMLISLYITALEFDIPAPVVCQI